MGQSLKKVEKIMKRILFNSDQVGGLAVILAIPVAAFNRIKQNYSTGVRTVSLSSSQDVIEIPVVNDHGYSFEEVQSTEDGGDVYDVSIQGVIPRSDADPKLRQELERGEWLVLHKDRNGTCRLSGSKDVPLHFYSNRTSGKTTANMNGNNFTFSAQESSPSEEVAEDFIIE